MNKNDVLVSVIVPIYNVQEYLQRCVNSILTQSHSNLEVVLVNDGSSDDSLKICKSFEEKDSRVRVLSQKNSGQAVARNRGLNVIVGNWVVFVDSDDWLEPTMIEDLLDVAISYDVDIASCAVNLINGKTANRTEPTKEITLFSPDEAVFDLYRQKKIRFEIWNKLWRKDVIGKKRFRKGHLCEEVDFDFDVFYKANKIAHIDKCLYNYVVQRPGNTISSFKKSKLHIFDDFEKMMVKYEREGNVKLKKIMSCIGAKFAMNLYLSAYRFHESKEILNFLKKRFDFFVLQNISFSYKTKKEIIQTILFLLSPTLYTFLFFSKNR